MKITSYASRTLTPAKKNYRLHSGKLEFLANLGTTSTMQKIFLYTQITNHYLVW